MVNEDNAASAANGNHFILCSLAKIVQKMDTILFVNHAEVKSKGLVV